MFTLRCKTLRVALPALLSLVALAGPTRVQAQECEDTPEGRICRVQQPIRFGTIIDPDRQRQLGLITINGGCSGTLLNRYWVLTARHCVTQTGTIPGPLVPPNQVRVTAAWAPGRVGLPSRIHDFAVNAAAPGSADIILVYLGTADLGPVDSQRIYFVVRGSVLTGQLTTSDTVTQYGQGFSTFATGVFGTPKYPLSEEPDS